MATPLKRQLLNNAVGAGVFHIASTFVALLSIPFLVHGLGIEGYGFLALLAAASKYGGFTDFGIGPSLTRQVAYHHARGEAREVRATATVGTLFYVGLLALATVASLSFAPAIVALGHYRDPAFVRDATDLLRIFIIAFFAGGVGGNFQSFLAGIGRLQLASKLGASISIAGTVLAVVAVSAHLGLVGVAGAIAVTAAINIVLPYLAARRAYGPILAAPASLTWPSARGLLATGGWIQLSTIMVILYAETDQLIVATVLGLAASGLFDVGRKLARAVRAVSFYFATALMPAVATIHSRGTESLEAIVVDGTRYLGVMTMFVSGLLYVSAPNVVTLWIGPGPHDATIVHVVRVLLVVYVIDSLQAVSITILRGTGTPKLEAFYSVTNALVNIALTVALVRPFGLDGILAGSLGGMAVASAVFSVAYCRSKGYDVRVSLGVPLLRLALASIASVATVTFALHFVPLADDGSKLHALLTLACASAMYALVYAVVIRIAGVLSMRDLAFAKASFPARLRSVFDAPIVRGMFVASHPPLEKAS